MKIILGADSMQGRDALDRAISGKPANVQQQIRSLLNASHCAKCGKAFDYTGDGDFGVDDFPVRVAWTCYADL